MGDTVRSSQTSEGRRRDAATIGRFLTRPGWLVVIPAAVSFLVWSINWPAGIRRGYDVRATIGPETIPYLIAWYGLLAVAASVGWAAGRETSPIKAADLADDERVYRWLTLIGAIGVVGMYVLVERRSPGLVVRALDTQQFNLVREQVAFAPGIATLRYATIPAGAIALHRLIFEHDRRVIHFVSLVLLVGSIMVSSRLSLVMCLLLLAGLAFTRSGTARSSGFKRRHVIALALLTVVLLGWANFVRNAHFYETYYDTRNPAIMLVGEVVSYVGAPTQVAVFTTTASPPVSGAQELVGGAVRHLTPKFLRDYEEDTQADWYRGRVSVANELTTNSVLASAYGQMGDWALAVLPLISMAAGALMGHFSRYRSYLVLASFVLGYGFAELWRVYIFASGVAVFLVLSLFATCMLVGNVQKSDSV